MTQSDLAKKTTKTTPPFLIRVVVMSIPVTLVILLVLYFTGYSPEEWPFVSGVFALSSIGSSTVVSLMVLPVLKGLAGFIRAVAIRQEIDVKEPENPSPNFKRARAAVFLAMMLPVAMASWGLAFYTLILIMAGMAMAPIGTHLPLIALTMLITGVVSFVVVVGGIAWLFYAIDRGLLRERSFSVRVQSWARITGDIDRKQSTLGVPILWGLAVNSRS